MTISVVIPCFNEEDSIPFFYSEMERIQIEMKKSLNTYL